MLPSRFSSRLEKGDAKTQEAESSKVNNNLHKPRNHLSASSNHLIPYFITLQITKFLPIAIFGMRLALHLIRDRHHVKANRQFWTRVLPDLERHNHVVLSLNGHSIQSRVFMRLVISHCPAFCAKVLDVAAHDIENPGIKACHHVS